MSVDYNPNKHRHISYKAQDVMSWVLQPWYKQMLSMNYLLVSCSDTHSWQIQIRVCLAAVLHLYLCH